MTYRVFRLRALLVFAAALAPAVGGVGEVWRPLPMTVAVADGGREPVRSMPVAVADGGCWPVHSMAVAVADGGC